MPGRRRRRSGCRPRPSPPNRAALCRSRATTDRYRRGPSPGPSDNAYRVSFGAARVPTPPPLAEEWEGYERSGGGESSEPDVFRDVRGTRALEILLDAGLGVTEQIVPLGPGLQKLLESVVVFAPQADVRGKIDGRRRQHEVTEIRVLVFRDERPEHSGDHRIGASRADGKRDRSDVVQLDAGRLWRYLLQDHDIRRAEHRCDLDFRLVIILPGAGLEPFAVDRIPVKIVSRAGEVDHQCSFRCCLQSELQVSLV